jgi:hypothetical protein
MHALDTINAFLEDTGLITALAYVLARGRILSFWFQERTKSHEAVRTGLILGAIGASEVIFPGDRYPYETDTLMIALAVLTGGPIVGAISAMTVSIVAIALQSWPNWPLTMALAFLTVGVTQPFRRQGAPRYNPFICMAAAMLAQIVAVAARYVMAPASSHLAHTSMSIVANGFGIVIMITVINDAWVRVNSERHRLDAERSKALAAQSQLSALRARIHPHFLYNALSSIAGMCAPSSLAQQTTIRLGQLMRQTLEMTVGPTVTLDNEIGHVRSYLDIERHRLGERVTVEWSVDPKCAGVAVPPLSVQTLVENAVNHGVAPSMDPGVISIAARQYRRHVLIAVRDNGLGMTRDMRRKIGQPSGEAIHGTEILARQLIILFGRRSRLRIFSGVDAGTLAVFVVPSPPEAVGASNGTYQLNRR